MQNIMCFHEGDLTFIHDVLLYIYIERDTRHCGSDQSPHIVQSPCAIVAPTQMAQQVFGLKGPSYCPVCERRCSTCTVIWLRPLVWFFSFEHDSGKPYASVCTKTLDLTSDLIEAWLWDVPIGG